MEISIVAPSSIKLKGKQAVFAVNPTSQTGDFAATLLIGKSQGKVDKDAIAFSGPGEYEVGGVKVTGIRGEGGVAFVVHMDGVDLLIGEADALAKIQNKVKEPHVIVMQTDTDIDASFVASFESRAALFYGNAAATVAEKLAKDGATKMTKFTAVKDKLPEELQVVVLG